MKNFRELNVWQKAHAFVLDIYRITASYPEEERFGLVSQIRRSAVSIPANIAEGCGRDGDREFRRFLTIAAGSASETEYHLLLSRDLNFITADIHSKLDQQINEIKRMLNGFIKKLLAVRH